MDIQSELSTITSRLLPDSATFSDNVLHMKYFMLQKHIYHR